MPKGPKGEWRPPDPGACAVHVMELATGQREETHEPPARPDPVDDSRRASAAGKARAAKLTPERRSEISKSAAAARWGVSQGG